MIISFAVRPMGLMVVILDETPMGLFRTLPGRGLFEMIITHPSHNIRYLEFERQGKLPNNVYYSECSLRSQSE